MDLKSFGQLIKIKYQQYADMVDDFLAEKVLSKFPQYTDMVEGKIKDFSGTSKPMEFKVGEGLSPEQGTEAEMVAKKKMLVPMGEDVKMETPLGKLLVPSEEEMAKWQKKEPEASEKQIAQSLAAKRLAESSVAGMGSSLEQKGIKYIQKKILPVVVQEARKKLSITTLPKTELEAKKTFLNILNKNDNITVYHETPIKNLSSIRRQGLTAEEGTFATIGKSSEFISGNKAIIEIQIPKSKFESITHDMRYGGEANEPFLDLLKEHKGLFGADISFNENIPKEWIKNIQAIKGIKSAVPVGKFQGMRPQVFKQFKDLTTKVLTKLEGKDVVSKQFISDLTNAPELKQVERDFIRNALNTYTYKGDKIAVQEFAEKVNQELLPLKSSISKKGNYENISLPPEIRGNIANYYERIWESPIKTSAAETHFSGQSENYFGHTRIEDMAYGESGRAGKSYAEDMLETAKDNLSWAKNKGTKFDIKKYSDEVNDLIKQVADESGLRKARSTRRVIEVQSDLYQKGGLEEEMGQTLPYEGKIKELEKSGKSLTEAIKIAEVERNEIVKNKLGQYNDPTAHFRMVREEVKQAAIDGKTKLQFPTGETAMKIEGLGQERMWQFSGKAGEAVNLTPENARRGMSISRGAMEDFVIVRKPEGGNVVVIPDKSFSELDDILIKEGFKKNSEKFWNEILHRSSLEREIIDISGKVDTNNPIYRFYEKDLGKYLKSKYNAQFIKDNKGVSWWQIDVKPEWGKMPVEAFGIGALFGLNKKNEIDTKEDIRLKIRTKGQQSFVPDKYKDIIARSSINNNISSKLLAAILQTENGKWEEHPEDNLANKTKDIGMPQLSLDTIEYIKKKMGDFDPRNVEEIINASAWLLNDIRERIGSDNPKDIAIAYHRGVSWFLTKNKRSIEDKKEAKNYADKFFGYFKQK